MTYIRTLCQHRFLLFLLIIFSIGVGRQALLTFLPYHLEKSLGFSSKDVGYAYLGSCLFSLIFQWLGPIFLTHLGIRMMLIVGFGSLIARLLIYSFISNGISLWIIIPTEFLNGLSFSFIRIAGVQEANICAPVGWEAAFQAAYMCAYVELPSVFAAFIGGYICKWYGARTLFLGNAILASLAFILLIILTFIENRRVVK